MLDRFSFLGLHKIFNNTDFAVAASSFTTNASSLHIFSHFDTEFYVLASNFSYTVLFTKYASFH